MQLTQANYGFEVVTADGENIGNAMGFMPDEFRVIPRLGQHFLLRHSTVSHVVDRVVHLYITSDRVLEYGKLV